VPSEVTDDQKIMSLSLIIIYTNKKRSKTEMCFITPVVQAENIFCDALYSRTEGVRIGGKIINHVRYADDTAIIAENMEDSR